MARPKRDQFDYDVFISHAVEDKIAVANDLDKALRDKGLRVWYSGKELSVGDELTETIYQGLDQSRFGVVIVSPTYLRKVWALGEFFRLTQRRGKSVLPVYYDITPEEVGNRYPPMANLVGVPMSAGMDVVVNKLIGVIQGWDNETPTESFSDKIRKYAKDMWVRLTTLITVVLVLGGVASDGLFSKIYYRPPADLIDKTIEQHIESMKRRVDERLHDFVRGIQRKPVLATDAGVLYDNFWNTKSHYRNEYTLVMPEQEVTGRRNVEMVLQQPLSDFKPTNSYFMPDAQVYLDGTSYVFYNTRPITYTTVNSGHEGDLYEVTINYTEGMRLVYTMLQFPKSEKDTRRHQVTLYALPPTETYTFIQKGEVWELQEIR